MRRAVVLSLAASVFLAFAVSASQAGVRYKMTYRQAINATLSEAQLECERAEGCRYYEAGPCARQSLRRFNCSATYTFPPTYSEAEVRCSHIMRWGVRAGFIQLIGTTRAECF